MKNKLPAIILAFSLIFLIIGAWFFTKSSEKQKNNPHFSQDSNEINGSIDLNGVPLSQGNIVLAYKEVVDTDFQNLETKIAISDGALWKIQNLKAGKAYEIQGHIELDDKKSDFTQIKTVVAPASDVIISVNNTHQPTEKKEVAINGSFDLNGYFPEGSKLQLYYSQTSENEKDLWKSVGQFSPQDKGEWSFENALAGKKYKLKTDLINSQKKTLAQSQEIEVLAPAQNEIIKINSHLQSPKTKPSQVGITGIFKFHGPLLDHSKVSLGVRKVGETEFQEVLHEVKAEQDLAWDFSQAISGQKYEIQGYLWVDEKPFSESQILTVAAPANHEVLKIQAQIPPEKPKAGTIKATCLKNKNDMYQIKIEFNTKKDLKNIHQYRIKMGYAADGDDLLDTVITPSNPDDQQKFTTNYILPKENVAYIRYATSTCKACNTFSEYSPVIQISCQ